MDQVERDAQWLLGLPLLFLPAWRILPSLYLGKLDPVTAQLGLSEALALVTHTDFPSLYSIIDWGIRVCLMVIALLLLPWAGPYFAPGI